MRKLGSGKWRICLCVHAFPHLGGVGDHVSWGQMFAGSPAVGVWLNGTHEVQFEKLFWRLWYPFIFIIASRLGLPFWREQLCNAVSALFTIRLRLHCLALLALNWHNSCFPCKMTKINLQNDCLQRYWFGITIIHFQMPLLGRENFLQLHLGTLTPSLLLTNRAHFYACFA